MVLTREVDPGGSVQPGTRLLTLARLGGTQLTVEPDERNLALRRWSSVKAEPVLRLEGVTKEYGEEVVTRVLHGIDLTLEQGKFAALIGPAGSGKSTLLNIIGLLDRASLAPVPTR